MTVQHCTADRTNINWTNKKMLINSARNINYHQFSYLTNFDDTFYMMFSKQNWLLKIIFQSTFKQSDFSSHLGKKSTGWCWSISAQYTNWVFCSDVAKLSKKSRALVRVQRTERTRTTSLASKCSQKMIFVLRGKYVEHQNR